MEDLEGKRARERRYYQEHCEVLRQRQAEYRQRNKERINARRKEQRDARRERSMAETEERFRENVQRTKGLVCTDCRWYLRRDTCSASFFQVITCGIHVAETCKAYDEQHD